MRTGKPEKKETEIEALARIVNAGFDRMDNQFADLRNETKADFAAVNKRIDGAQQALGYRIDQLDAKLDQHRQEDCAAWLVACPTRSPTTKSGSKRWKGSN